MFCPIGVPPRIAMRYVAVGCLSYPIRLKYALLLKKHFIIVVDIINEIIRKNLTLWRARRPHPQV